jgi:hypothetical protein
MPGEEKKVLYQVEKQKAGSLHILKRSWFLGNHRT